MAGRIGLSRREEQLQATGSRVFAGAHGSQFGLYFFGAHFASEWSLSL